MNNLLNFSQPNSIIFSNKENGKMEAILNIVSKADEIKQQIKSKFLSKQKEQETVNEKEQIISSLKETEQEIKNARSKFDMQTDFELIDISILELNALEKKYSYLLKEAKKQRKVSTTAS